MAHAVRSGPVSGAGLGLWPWHTYLLVLFQRKCAHGGQPRSSSKAFHPGPLLWLSMFKSQHQLCCWKSVVWGKIVKWRISKLCSCFSWKERPAQLLHSLPILSLVLRTWSNRECKRACCWENRKRAGGLCVCRQRPGAKVPCAKSES